VKGKNSKNPRKAKLENARKSKTRKIKDCIFFLAMSRLIFISISGEMAPCNLDDAREGWSSRRGRREEEEGQEEGEGGDEERRGRRRHV